MGPQKAISQEKALQARGLFALASLHYKKMRAAERALSELLGYENEGYCEYLSDEVYDDRGGSFDRGLSKDGYVVKAPTTKQKRKR